MPLFLGEGAPRHEQHAYLPSRSGGLQKPGRKGGGGRDKVKIVTQTTAVGRSGSRCSKLFDENMRTSSGRVGKRTQLDW